MKLNVFETSTGNLVNSVTPVFKSNPKDSGADIWEHSLNESNVQKIPKTNLKFSKIRRFFFTKKNFFFLDDKIKKKIYGLKKLERDIVKKIIFYDIPIGYKRTCHIGLGVLPISNFYNFCYFNKNCKIGNIKFKKRIMFKSSNIPSFIPVQEINDDVSFKLLGLSLSISNKSFLKLRYTYTKINNLRDN
jgi:hypothetical protein